MARTQITGNFVKDNSLTNLDFAVGSPGQIVITDATGRVQAVTMSGDASITSAGVITVGGGGDPAFKRVTSVNATATLVPTQAGLITVDASGGAVTLTLPTPASCAGYEFEFVKSDATTNLVTISSGAASFFNKTSYAMKYKFQQFKVKSDGTTWYVPSIGPVFGMLTQSEIPAYYNNASGFFESLARVQYGFQNNGSARNIYLLNYGTFTSQSPNGAIIPRNAIIKSIWISLGANTASAVAIQVQKNGSTVIATLNLASGVSSGSIDNVNVALTALDEISVYVSATSNINNPQVTVDIAWKD